MNDIVENLTKENNLEWKVENSNENSVLFYYLPEDTDQRREQFKARIEKCSYKKCIINSAFEFNQENIMSFETKEWFSLLEKSCNKLYPLEDACRIAITGTNGKTTTTDILRQLLIAKNKKVLTVGTLGIWLNEEKINDYSLTTPNYIDLRKELYKNKHEYLVVEASSHALEQNRFNNLNFDYSAWTSFSQDHLDYHKSMNSYFEAKKIIFSKTNKKVFVHETESFLNKISSSKLEIVNEKNYNINNYFNIKYNNKNLQLALSILNEESLIYTQEELERLMPTPGRFNILEKDELSVIIDFAHTPDALINIGKELKNMKKNAYLITVFGCGGDRDREKRSLMAKACEEFSTRVIVTSDNPRTEDPMQILRDIECGFSKSNYKLIVDRKEAIRESIKESKEHGNCIVLVAGKGHENYIDKDGIKTYYSDEVEVKKAIDDIYK